MVTSGGTLSLNNSIDTTTNGNVFSGTTFTMSGNSTLVANSVGLSANSTLNMNGTSSISVANSFNVSASQAYLNGSSTLSANSMSVFGGSWFKIGDGSLGSPGTSAHVSISNGFSVDNTSNMGIANNNNYLLTSNNTLKTNTISCGGGGTQNACTTGYVYGCATISNTVGTACTILALASINLSLSDAGPGQVRLSWTDNETSAADQYSIQRSTPGREWASIGTIAAGNATGDYNFTDAAAPAGTVDYRIKRTDADGNTLYSSISSITVTGTGNGTDGLIGIHPNPATGGTFFITTASTGQLVVNVYTMTGQLLLRTALQGQTQYTIHLPLQQQSLGSVVVQIIGQTGNRTFTLLVR